MLNNTTAPSKSRGLFYFHSSRTKLRYSLVALLTFFLMAANLIGGHELKFFYFSFSTGTLFFHLIVISLITLLELYGEDKVIKIVWLTGFLNLLFNLVSYFVFLYPIPPYWSIVDMAAGDHWRQMNVILLLAMDYICAGLGMVWFGAILRKQIPQWFVLRVALLCFIALVLDLILLLPIIIFLSQDNYEVAWRMLSLCSVKSVTTLFAIPISVLFISWLKIHLSKKH